MDKGHIRVSGVLFSEGPLICRGTLIRGFPSLQEEHDTPPAEQGWKEGVSVVQILPVSS